MQKGAVEEGGMPGAPAGGGEPVPQAPGEMPGVATGPETPPVGEDILADVAEAFREIANIHGQVYLCGAVLQNRLDLGIEVLITDPTDKATIVNSFADDPLLKPIADNKDIHFRTEPPSTPVLDVTPGTTGLTPAPYQPSPDEGAATGGAPAGPPPATPAGAPPDLSSMMGGMGA
jgi:hypothetical protein